jgi:hexulose-6-phosphate isomerase
MIRPMPPSRRAFLCATTASALATATLGKTTGTATTAPKWRLAYMLGTSEGPIRPRFDELREAGFEGVELLSPNKLDRDEVLKARDATGIVIHGVSGSVHWGSPLSDPDPAVVARGVAAIRQEIDDIAAYGGNTVLVVPAVVTPRVSYQEAWDRSRQAIEGLIPAAESKKVVLAIEEVWNRFLLSPLEFARYVDQFQTHAVQAYFDVGNVVEFGYPQEWIRVLGPRIVKIHVKEYAKPKRFDYLLGEGEIDWAAVRAALDGIGYAGWITAEVPWTGVDGMKDVVARMKRLLEIA